MRSITLQRAATTMQRRPMHPHYFRIRSIMHVKEEVDPKRRQEIEDNDRKMEKFLYVIFLF